MTYRTLKAQFHAHDSATAEALYQARLNSEASLKWDFPVGDYPLFCMIVPEILHQVESAYRRELKVQQVWEQLPGGVHAHYIRSLLLDEVVSTNALEGVHSTRKEIEEVLEADDAGIAQRRFREMSRLYLSFAEGNAELPRTPADIRNLFDSLMQGSLEEGNELDGVLFRKGDVSIIDHRQQVIHKGFHPEEEIHRGLKTMLEVMNDSAAPALVTAVVSHFMFETIHPFYDGNGRTGRYLLGLHLSQILSIPTALTLSQTLNNNKTSYYKAFQAVEAPLNKADATPFAITLLKSINSAQENLLEDLIMRSDLLVKLSQRITEFSTENSFKLSEKAINLLYLLGQVRLFGSHGTMTLEEAAHYLDASTTTVRRHFKRLEEADLVTIATQRPIRFRLSELGLAALGLPQNAV